MPEQLAQDFPVQGRNKVVNWIKREVSRVSDQMMNRAVVRNVWSALLKQEQFENGNGYTQRVATWERTALTSQPQLQPMNQYNATHMPHGDVITQGWSERSFTIGWITRRSQTINIFNVHTVQNFHEQLAHYMKVLSDTAIQINSDLNEQGFASQVDYKVVARSEDGEIPDGLFPSYDSTDGKTQWKNIPPTAVPTPEFMEKLKKRLDIENASEGGSVFSGNGTTYQLICSAELSKFLRRGGAKKNADGSDNTDYMDIRYMSDALKKRFEPFGSPYSYNGFQHLINPLAPRYKYNFAAGKFERVMPYRDNLRHNVGNARQTTESQEWNKEYEEAPFEMFHIFTPNVCRSVVMNVNNNVGPAKFNASSTLGQWEFFCPKDLSNCWGDNGFLQWRMIKGIKPYNTRAGITVLCLRPKFLDMYSTAGGTLITPKGRNGEDTFFYGDYADKTMEEFETAAASLEGYNSYTNLHIGLPSIPEDGEMLWTGIADAVPVDPDWAYPYGRQPHKGDKVEFKEGAKLLMVSYTRAEGKELVATISDKTGDVQIDHIEYPSPNQAYVFLLRSDETEAVSGTLNVKVKDADNDGSDIYFVGAAQA